MYRLPTTQQQHTAQVKRWRKVVPSKEKICLKYVQRLSTTQFSGDSTNPKARDSYFIHAEQELYLWTETANTVLGSWHKAGRRLFRSSRYRSQIYTEIANYIVFRQRHKSKDGGKLFCASRKYASSMYRACQLQFSVEDKYKGTVNLFRPHRKHISSIYRYCQSHSSRIMPQNW